MTTTETLVVFCAMAMMACVIILVRSIVTLRNIDKGLRCITADTLDNMAQIKRLQVELESLKEANRRLVNGEKGNEAEHVHPGRPDIQCSGGDTSVGGADEEKREIGFITHQDEAPGADIDPKQDTAKGA